MHSIEKSLKCPFPAKALSWRVGSTNKDKTKGMMLAYIDARDVMKRLDQVCGFDGWRDEYREVQGRIVCKLWIRVGQEWTWREDGAGDTDTEGQKGGLSDAFKRAAVKWGVGRYLYDLPSPWVALNQYKQPESGWESAINLPVWATPEGFTKLTEGL